MKFLLVMEKTETGYSAYCSDLPGCIATGKTRAETERSMREAIQLHVEGLREGGQKIPKTASEHECRHSISSLPRVGAVCTQLLDISTPFAIFGLSRSMGGCGFGCVNLSRICGRRRACARERAFGKYPAVGQRACMHPPAFAFSTNRMTCAQWAIGIMRNGISSGFITFITLMI